MKAIPVKKKKQSGEISKNRGLSINPDIYHSKVPSSESKTLEWDFFNLDLLIDLEINNKRTSNI